MALISEKDTFCNNKNTTPLSSLRVFCSCKAQDLQIQNVSRIIETVFFNTSNSFTQQVYYIDTP